MKKNKLIILFSIIIVLLVGIFAQFYVKNLVKEEQEKSLLLRAKNITTLLDPNLISVLEGSQNDLSKKEYVFLKEKIIKLDEINPDSRFVYLMGLKNGEQFFYVDSEDVNSPDYSPPGQIYQDATDEDIYNHENGIAYVSGPYEDDWGTWYSSYAPVLLEDEVVAMVGIDVSAKTFLRNIYTAQLVEAIISLLILSFLIMSYIFVDKSNKYTELIEKNNLQISLEKEKLLEISELAGIAIATWSSAKKTVSVNSKFKEILGIDKDMFSIEDFTSFIPKEDRENIENNLKLGNLNQVLKFNHKIISPTSGTTEVISSCKIKKDSQGNMIYATCAVVPINK